jgi:hypothetical protein
MRSRLKILLTCVLSAVIVLALAEPAKQAPGEVIAVNVLLQPDQESSGHAVRINGLLRQSDPRGFALDASHVPHISVLQGYVEAKNLPAIYRAVERVSTKLPLAGRQLTVLGLEHKPWGDQEITNIKIAKTRELETFQADLVSAISPYLLKTGDGTAFLSSTGDPDVDQKTIEYVRTFVQKHTGAAFEPHITVGISDAETALKVSAQQEAPAKLTVASVAVFQLGNVGTARKELWRQSPR